MVKTVTIQEKKRLIRNRNNHSPEKMVQKKTKNVKEGEKWLRRAQNRKHPKKNITDEAASKEHQQAKR